MEQHISPTIICMDLCNLERDARQLEKAGCTLLHIDILDGYFSPSMPVGLDTVKQLKAKTNMEFDAHVMAIDNTYFMEKLAEIGVSRMCFQVETERHISRKLSWLKEHNIKAGVALAPATSLSTIECVLEQCDFVVLMMINPGYASNPNEKVLESLSKKIVDLKNMIVQRGLNTTITVDGRTFLDLIPKYISLGADTIVAGSSCLFRKNGLTIEENYEILNETVQSAIKERGKNGNNYC